MPANDTFNGGQPCVILGVLLKEMLAVASGAVAGKPYRLKYEVPQLSEAVAKTAELLGRSFPKLPHVEWIALRLLEGDRRVIAALESRELGQLAGDHGASEVC